MSQEYPIPSFNVGDKAIADGDPVVITQIIYPPDSEMFTGEICYGVVWPKTNEYGGFKESELEKIKDE